MDNRHLGPDLLKSFSVAFGVTSSILLVLVVTPLYPFAALAWSVTETWYGVLIFFLLAGLYFAPDFVLRIPLWPFLIWGRLIAFTHPGAFPVLSGSAVVAVALKGLASLTGVAAAMCLGYCVAGIALGLEL